MSAPRVMLAALVARGAFGLAFLAEGLGRLPVLLYYPLEHRFALERPGSGGSGLSMAWFGATAFGLLTAGGGFALTWLGSARGPAARWLVRPEVVLGVARAVGLMMLVDFAYFGWTLTHQTPAPLSLPAWYWPR